MEVVVQLATLFLYELVTFDSILLGPHRSLPRYFDNATQVMADGTAWVTRVTAGLLVGNKYTNIVKIYWDVYGMWM